MCGPLVFFQLWDSSSEGGAGVTANGGPAVWACGALWQKPGIAHSVAWYRVDYRSENRLSC